MLSIGIPNNLVNGIAFFEVLNVKIGRRNGSVTNINTNLVDLINFIDKFDYQNSQCHYFYSQISV